MINDKERQAEGQTVTLDKEKFLKERRPTRSVRDGKDRKKEESTHTAAEPGGQPAATLPLALTGQQAGMGEKGREHTHTQTQSHTQNQKEQHG